MKLTNKQALQAFDNCVDLPAIAFFDHDDEGLCMITRGEQGYTRLYSNVPAETFNRKLRITTNQVRAMITGSMWGFHVPAAGPQHPANLS